MQQNFSDYVKRVDDRFCEYVRLVYKFYRRNDDDHDYYHTIEHVVDMFNDFGYYEKDFDKEFGDTINKKNLFLAIAYHDSFYVPGVDYNEDMSVKIAERELRNYDGISANDKKEIYDLIYSTGLSDFEDITTDSAKILHDLDWYCFNYDTQLDKSTHGIINEAIKISNYTLHDCLRGRIAFLESLVGKDIYLTETFAEKGYNNFAQKHIKNHIRELNNLYYRT